MRIINYKQLRSECKKYLNKHSSAEILSFIGYEVTKNYFLKLHEEQTPSSSIDDRGGIKNFATGKYYSDPIAVLHECKNISLSEATIYVANLLNIDIERFKDE